VLGDPKSSKSKETDYGLDGPGSVSGRGTDIPSNEHRENFPGSKG
jgi:hypothetical protein